MSRLEWIKKIIIIVVGSVVAAYGITLALYAGFGGATLAVLWQGISETFHVSIGMASMIVAIIMITFAFFYDRSQIHIGTILYQIVYSFCVDLFANIHGCIFYYGQGSSGFCPFSLFPDQKTTCWKRTRKTRKDVVTYHYRN